MGRYPAETLEGDGAQLLQTSRLAYWRLNGPGGEAHLAAQRPGGEAHLAQLGLAP